MKRQIGTAVLCFLVSAYFFYELFTMPQYLSYMPPEIQFKVTYLTLFSIAMLFVGLTLIWIEVANRRLIESQSFNTETSESQQ